MTSCSPPEQSACLRGCACASVRPARRCSGTRVEQFRLLRFGSVSAQLGGIRLLERLGSGGFASVWLASDEAGTKLAAKILHEEHAASPRIVRRFAEEARILGRLDHPNIPKLIGIGLSESPPYFLLEHVHGENLRTRLYQRARERAFLPIRGACWIAREIGHALVHAHQLGIVHRDLKPANVLVNHPHHRPVVKVLDFGAAHTLAADEDERTTRGRQVGSLSYMAPEQVGAREITARTDVFALGVILFELLTLRRCWSVGEDGERISFAAEPSDNRIDVQVRIERGERPAVSHHRPDVPRALDDVIMRALAPAPTDRFPSIQRFLEAMRLASAEDPVADDSSVITEPAPVDV